MRTVYLTALLAAGAAAAQAESPVPAVPIQPSVDSAEERQTLRALSACLAKARPGWARSTLSHAYLSDEQASAAAQALSGTDNCIRGSQAEVTFRTSGMVGSLAEHFLQTDVQKADAARLKSVLSTMTPRNVTEDFALCVASRDPAAARDLALSEPGSAAEGSAAQRAAVHVAPCLNPGEDLKVELQSLRALLSTALYRATTTVLAARH